MQKKLATLLSVVLVPLTLVTCSKLDTFTSAGSEVIHEFDPTLVKFEDNFYPVDFDSSLVAGVGSLPGSSVSGFGSHYKKLAAGRFINHWVYGSMSFTLSESLAKKIGTTRTIDSVTFIIDTIGTAPLIAPVTPSVTKLSLHFTTDTLQFYQEFPDSTTTQLASLDAVKADTFSATPVRFTGKADSSLADTIAKRISSYLQCMDKKGTSCGGTLSKPIFFSLFNHDTTMIWFKDSPKMVIHSHDTADKPYTDSIYKTTMMYFAQESDSLITALASIPVSTYLARRTAEFKIDCQPLWDSLENSGFSELLSASFVLEVDSFSTESSSKDSQAVIYGYCSAERITDGLALDNKLNTELHFYTDTLSSNDTIVMPLTTTLQKSYKTKPPYLYLYLQIGSSYINIHQELFWKKPQLKTVLTTLR